jgi:hypothetical protein
VVLVILPYIGEFWAFEEMDVLHTFVCKLGGVETRRTSRGGCDAMALGNVAAGYMEAASDSCEL